MGLYDDNIEITELMIKKALKKVYTSLPAVITAVDPPNMKVKVRIRRTEALPDILETGWINLRALYAGAGHGLCLIPYVNDECILMFNDKNLNDAYVIPMSFDDTDKPPIGHVPLRVGDCLLKHKTGAMILMDKDGNIELWQQIGNHFVLFDGFLKGATINDEIFSLQRKNTQHYADRKEVKEWTHLQDKDLHFVIQKREMTKYSNGNPDYCPIDNPEGDPAGGGGEVLSVINDEMFKFIQDGALFTNLDIFTNQSSENSTKQRSYRATYNKSFNSIVKIETKIEQSEARIEIRAYRPDVEGMKIAGLDIWVDDLGPHIEQIQQGDGSHIEFNKELAIIEREKNEEWNTTSENLEE